MLKWRRSRSGKPVRMEYLEVRRLLSAAATTTTLKTSSDEVIYDQTVTFTAKVKAHNGSPSGTVTFLDGAATLGAIAINTSNHKAILSMPLITIGTNSITAIYGGTTDFATSTSAVLTETVNPTPTTTKITSSLNPATVGQSVTLTATVDAPSGSPGGIITFDDNNTFLGTAAINTLTNQATFTTSTLPVGLNSLTALYGGTTHFATSGAKPLTETIAGVESAVALSPSTTSPTFGETVTLTAAVTAASGIPGGTVVFEDGSKTLGTAPVNTATQMAIFTTSSLAIGSHNLTAVYEGTSIFAPSKSKVLKESVSPAPPATMTNLTSSTNPATAGQVVTLTAAVTASKGSPSGTVTFTYGATTLGSAAVSTSDHKASIMTTSLPVGSDGVTAWYSGTKGFAASSSELTETINSGGPLTTFTTVESSLNPATFTQDITLTAVVTASTGSPGGTVTFLNGNSTVGVADVNTGTHKASIETSTLAVGDDVIVAVYSGTTGFASSSSINFPQTIFPIPVASTTTLVSSSSSSMAGDVVTLTATVTSTGGSPGGTVTFDEGTVDLGNAVINTSTNQAVLETSALAVGTDSVTAVYNGTIGFSPSTSSAISQTVSVDPTTTTVTISDPAATLGQIVTLTANVINSSGSAAPTGTVLFTSGGITLGSAAVNNAGQASFTEYTAFTNIQANYSGDSEHSASLGTATYVGGNLPALTTSSTGLQYATLVPGTGATVPVNSYIQVNYEGFLTNGTEFDSSADHGGPQDFSLEHVIVGWQQNIPGMLVGETRLLIVPSNLGYGPTGSSPNIPGNATLIFTVQMLAIVPRVTVTDTANSAAVTMNGTPSSSNGTLFPNTASGSSSSAVSFELGNADSSFDLTYGTLQISGADPSDFVLTQPSSGVFTVTFTPNTTGPLTATITIPSNDPGVADFTFTVSGTGT
jgi:hypothetical protein